MFDDLTRLPTTRGEVAADVVRALGLVSFVAACFIGGTAIPLFALILLGQLLPRFLAMRSALDIATGCVLLVAGWSNPLELYRAIPQWDLVIHFAANGLIAAIAYVLFQRLTHTSVEATARGRANTIILTTAFGMSTGVLWELGEWFGHTVIDSRIVVEYNDTIGDLAIGALGSLVVGYAMSYASTTARRSEPSLSESEA